MFESSLLALLPNPGFAWPNRTPATPSPKNGSSSRKIAGPVGASPARAFCRLVVGTVLQLQRASFAWIPVLLLVPVPLGPDYLSSHLHRLPEDAVKPIMRWRSRIVLAGLSRYPDLDKV